MGNRELIMIREKEKSHKLKSEALYRFHENSGGKLSKSTEGVERIPIMSLVKFEPLKLHLMSNLTGYTNQYPKSNEAESAKDTMILERAQDFETGF